MAGKEDPMSLSACQIGPNLSYWAHLLFLCLFLEKRGGGSGCAVRCALVWVPEARGSRLVRTPGLQLVLDLREREVLRPHVPPERVAHGEVPLADGLQRLAQPFYQQPLAARCREPPLPASSGARWHRQTDRQTDRQTVAGLVRDQRNGWCMGREADRRMDRQTDRQTDRRWLVWCAIGGMGRRPDRRTERRQDWMRHDTRQNRTGQDKLGWDGAKGGGPRLHAENSSGRVNVLSRSTTSSSPTASSLAILARSGAEAGSPFSLPLGRVPVPMPAVFFGRPSFLASPPGSSACTRVQRRAAGRGKPPQDGPAAAVAGGCWQCRRTDRRTDRQTSVVCPVLWVSGNLGRMEVADRRSAIGEAPDRMRALSGAWVQQGRRPPWTSGRLQMEGRAR
jgi:hypothetical protein